MCGLLLVRAGELVAVERFVDELWPDQPPSDARALVRGYVSRLRRAMRCGPSAADRLVTRKPGYLLRVEDDELDARRFESLLNEARVAVRAGEPRRAVGLFRQAHALWAGDPFADVPLTASLAAAATWLTEQRLAAREEYFDAALTVGPLPEVITELTEFVTAHPLRERAAGQLMLALYQSGRQAEALEQYQRVTHALAEEVGIDPGVDLRRLHQKMLEADPALNPPRAVAEPRSAASTADTARAPRQLPRDLPTFVSRTRELACLDALLGADGDARTAPMIVLHGAPGVGKSALAVHAAHLAASRFPDGQLHVNLRGATPDVKPLSAIEALHQLLRALDAIGAAVPTDVDQAAALFRSVVVGRRLLIILDNAATAAQVRPLIPGCAVILTSRTRLLTLEGATHLQVDPLSPDEAWAMLVGLVTDARPTAETAATRRLAQLCGHLPLGLHIAAARLNARPSWAVSNLVDRLADERNRLAELAAGDAALRSSIAVSHTVLYESDNPIDQSAAQALCLFGLLPIPDFDLDLAAAVLEIPPEEADRIVERLLDAHLVEEHAPGRFHMHDLTRLFAHEQATGTLPEQEQHTVFERLVSHYLATTCLANTLVYPHRAHHPAPQVVTTPRRLADEDQAQQWLEEQCHNMIAVVRRALSGPDEHARLGIGLALALHWYLHSGASDLPDTISVQADVVAAAERLGDRRSLAYAHGNLAVNLKHIGRLDEACVHSSAELALCRELGDRFGEQRALGNLGHTYLARRLPDQAATYLEQQLELARDIDAPLGQAFALVNLGKARHRLGRSDQAIAMIETAMAWYEKTGDHYRRCDVHEVLAQIHIDLGDYGTAITIALRGLNDARHIAYRFGEIWALTALAKAHRLSGDPGTARRYAEQAVAASDSLRGTDARAGALAEHAQLTR
jgi:DNA-binding SARP family transcriptional activator